MQLSPVPSEQLDVEVEYRRRELRLLHFPLDRAALRTLLIWDSRRDVLRDARPGEVVDDSTPVMVLHLWATWCTPCKEEFPIWREVGATLDAQHKGRVRIAHVAMQNDSAGMARFVGEMQDRLPFPLNHFDRNERLADRLKLVDKQLNLPLTLILDQDRVVRQAFIGPISQRRQELVDSIARLMRLVKVQLSPVKSASGEPGNTKPAAPSTKPESLQPVKIYGID